MINPNKILGNILGRKPKVYWKSKNSEDRNVEIGGPVTKSEYEKIKQWFELRFPDSSFDDFARRTKLRIKEEN